MDKKATVALVILLGLIGGGALFLGYLSGNYQLGEVGVKLTGKPLFDEKSNLSRTNVTYRTNSVYLPERVMGRSSRPLKITRTELDWLPNDTRFGRRFYRDFEGIGTMISVVLMGSDRTSIHKPQYCLTGQGWKIEQSERTMLRIEEPYPYALPVQKLTTRKKVTTKEGKTVVRHGVFVYWFVSGDQITADHWERMWWMARDLVTEGVLKRWAYIAFFTPCAPGEEEETFESMKAFIAAAVPQFQQVTSKARIAPEALKTSRLQSLD